MKPSIRSAKQELIVRERFTHFSAYSTAYVATNEDNLRNTLKHIPENAQNALTVAGSGDHPMFTQLYGIAHVDTFDVSWRVSKVQDIVIENTYILQRKR